MQRSNVLLALAASRPVIADLSDGVLSKVFLGESKGAACAPVVSSSRPRSALRNWAPQKAATASVGRLCSSCCQFEQTSDEDVLSLLAAVNAR